MKFEIFIRNKNLFNLQNLFIKMEYKRYSTLST